MSAAFTAVNLSGPEHQPRTDRDGEHASSHRQRSSRARHTRVKASDPRDRDATARMWAELPRYEITDERKTAVHKCGSNESNRHSSRMRSTKCMATFQERSSSGVFPLCSRANATTLHFCERMLVKDAPRRMKTRSDHAGNCPSLMGDGYSTACGRFTSKVERLALRLTAFFFLQQNCPGRHKCTAREWARDYSITYSITQKNWPSFQVYYNHA